MIEVHVDENLSEALSQLARAYDDMQFGARKGEFGAYSGTNRKGHPYSGVAPWGDIPARPYLGLSQEDQVTIHALLADYLATVVPGGM